MPDPNDLANAPTVDRPNAPVVFFEGVRGLLHLDGTIGATLTALIVRGGPSEVTQVEHAVMAHLRTNLEGAKILRRALDQAILMAEPIQGDRN